MTKSILFFNGSGCGGAERMTILFAKILQSAGFTCKMFIHVKPGNKVYLSEFIPNNLKIEIIETRNRFLLFHLMKILINEKCDIVFSSMPILIQMLILAKWIVRGNFKIVARCFNMPSMMPPSEANIIKWCRYSNVIISQTTEMSQELISLMRFPPKKIITIYNPIDTELINTKIKESFFFDSDYVNFSAVGRIASQKDYITMITAFKEVTNTIPNSRLYIIGKVQDQQYYDLIQSKIKEYGLSEHVYFEGFQTNPYKYIYHSDAFLLSSQFEGLPNVLLDALYLNKPVVATRSIPFIQQVIKEGVNGYSVNVCDSQAFSVGMLNSIKLKNINNKLFSGDSDRMIIKLFSE